jgi:hypothetical protein
MGARVATICLPAVALLVLGIALAAHAWARFETSS